MPRRKSYTLNHAYDSALPTGIRVNLCSFQSKNQYLNPDKRSTSFENYSALVTCKRPEVSKDAIVNLLLLLYGITASEVIELKSYDDRNYHISVDP